MKHDSKFSARHKNAGMSLVEVLVTMGIFLGLATIMVWMVKEVTAMWSSGERRRVLFERAASSMDMIQKDLSLSLTREPAGVDDVRVRLIGDIDPDTGGQRLMFVRSFEPGPERALTFRAGNGLRDQLSLRNELVEISVSPPTTKNAQAGRPDTDFFIGNKVGDYRPLGGMAQVAYFVRNELLYRALRAPAEGPFLELFNPVLATPLVEDALFLGFDYWSQFTTVWDIPARRSKNIGPEKIWDSTRGIPAPPLNAFILHRGRESLNDPSDDVFPEKIRVTFTVDSSMPKCVHTKLDDDLGFADGVAWVLSTRGFPAGGTDRSYIKIGNEWMHYKDKKEDRFIFSVRGARGTKAADHAYESVVRCGQTFVRTIFLPAYREDWMPDDQYFLMREEEQRRRGLKP